MNVGQKSNCRCCRVAAGIENDPYLSSMTHLFTEAVFEKKDFREAPLAGAVFDRTNLEKADFRWPG
jgi:uncharacterized protein YjbI with pentapeptide repeats